MSDQVHHRQLSIDSTRADDNARTVDASISSTEPYERHFGFEVLSHDQNAIDFTRAKDGLALLLDHDPTKQVGRIEKIRIDGSRLRCSLRFSNSAQASEVWDDVKNGIRTDLSVGYQVIEMNQTGERNNTPEYTVTKWMPLEASIVAIPADHSVGIGRAHKTSTLTLKGKKNMTQEITEAVENEKARVREISAIADDYPELHEYAREAINADTSVERFRKFALKQIGTPSPLALGNPIDEIGLSQRELKNYKFMNAIRAQMGRQFEKDAGFELEVSRAVAQKSGKDPKGIYIPGEVLKRDLNIGTTTAGGHMKGTDHMGDSFVEMLRNRTLVKQMGATVLSGLRGDVQIPTQTGAATAYWVAEGADLTESQQTLGQVTLAPKTVGAFTDFTRKMLIQSSPDVEQMVQRDLASVLALETDRVAINGTGAGDQPTGILNTSGLSLVALGTNGATPDWPSIVNLEGELTTANADMGSLGYLTNAAVRKKLKQITKVSADAGAGFIWEGGNDPEFGSLNGYRAGVSNNVPSNLTKGTGVDLSAILFGNFADLLIGEWSGIDLQVDPTTLGLSGGIRLIVFQDIDIAVRHIESFAAITDAITV